MSNLCNMHSFEENRRLRTGARRSGVPRGVAARERLLYNVGFRIRGVHTRAYRLHTPEIPAGRGFFCKNGAESLKILLTKYVKRDRIQYAARGAEGLTKKSRNFLQKPLDK